MSPDTERQAVIYCRVASTHMSSPHGCIAEQEARCREYAAQKGYQVATVFCDIGVSDAGADRPGMQDMLAFLRGTPSDAATIVIVDDMSRLARAVPIYYALRIAIEDAGERLESPSFIPADTAESSLMEGILASFDGFNARLDQEEEAAEAR